MSENRGMLLILLALFCLFLHFARTSGELGYYFQYNSNLYHMKADYDYLDATRTLVDVELETGQGSNCGRFHSGSTRFAGPIANLERTKLYILGSVYTGGCGALQTTAKGLIELDVSQGVQNITGRVLYQGSAIQKSAFGRSAAGWDPQLNAVFWCYGSLASSIDFGDCYNFRPDNDSTPQAWGVTGIGSSSLVGSETRGPAVIGLIEGEKHLFLAGKLGVFRQTLSGDAGPTGSNVVQLVDKTDYAPFGGAFDNDQFGYGLLVFNNSELWFTSRLQGVFSIADPHSANLTSPRTKVFSFQGYTYFFGLAIHPVMNRIYVATRAWWAGGPLVGCTLGGLTWIRGEYGWRYDSGRVETQLSQEMVMVTNCDLSDVSVGDYEGNAWMAIAGPGYDSTIPLDSVVERGPSVHPLNSSDELKGVIMHVTDSNTGNTEYYYTNGPEQTHILFLECSDLGGGMRSNIAIDRDFGWGYVICQHKLIRLNLPQLFAAGYGWNQSQVMVYANGNVWPNNTALVEVITDHYTGDIAQNPGYGFFMYREHFAYGGSLSLEDGVLYMTSRSYKASVYPTHDLMVWAFRLGIDKTWLPLALVPNTPGSNQAGKIEADSNGNLYLAIGNQVDQSTNGLWMISSPWNFYRNQGIRQVFDISPTQTTVQMYGWAIHMNVTGMPEWLWVAHQNDTYTDYSSDLSSFGKIPWIGDTETGLFDYSGWVQVGDVFHRGNCLYGCNIWTILAILEDPDTSLLWLVYESGDAEHWVTNYDPVTGIVDDSCYFFSAASAVTHPKQSTLWYYGNQRKDSCQCPRMNGVETKQNGTYILPGSSAVGNCAVNLWWLPIVPAADLIGRCAFSNCTSCSAPPPLTSTCTGFLPQCSLSCCNSGFNDGNWVATGFSDDGYSRPIVHCTGERAVQPSTLESTSTTISTTSTTKMTTKMTSSSSFRSTSILESTSTTTSTTKMTTKMTSSSSFRSTLILESTTTTSTTKMTTKMTSSSSFRSTLILESTTTTSTTKMTTKMTSSSSFRSTLTSTTTSTSTFSSMTSSFDTHLPMSTQTKSTTTPTSVGTSSSSPSSSQTPIPTLTSTMRSSMSTLCPETVLLAFLGHLLAF